MSRSATQTPNMTTRLRGSSSESYNHPDWRRHGYLLFRAGKCALNIAERWTCFLWPAGFSIHCSVYTNSYLNPVAIREVVFGFFLKYNSLSMALPLYISSRALTWHLIGPPGPRAYIHGNTGQNSGWQIALRQCLFAACFYSNSGQLFWKLTLKAQSVVDHYLAGMIASSLLPWFAQFGREIAIKGTRLQLSACSYRYRNVWMFLRTSRHEILRSIADMAAWAFRAIHLDDTHSWDIRF